MKRILWCSDNPLIPTGYSQVTRNIGMRLKRAGFDFHSLGFQQFSMPIDEVKTQVGWIEFPIKPTMRFAENYGDKGSIEFWVETLKPHITVFLSDSFMIRHLITPRIRDVVIERTIDKLKTLTSLWMYYPFDSADVYEGAAELLSEMHTRIAMSKFGQRLLKKKAGLDSFYIPHGVDTLVYRPLPEGVINEIKKRHNIDGKFIIGSVFRNQTRKLPTKLLKAFKLFAEDKKDVLLLLHTDAQDPQGQNLNDFIDKRIKLDRSKVKFTGMNFISGVSNHEVNLLYNVMDIHALSTTGEGFGLPIIESHAAGTPNVITDYTTSRELLDDGRFGQLVKVKEFIEGQMNTSRAIVDVEHMADCFEKYYNKPNLVKKHGKLAREFTIEHYNWEKVLRMWIELIQFGEIYERA